MRHAVYTRTQWLWALWLLLPAINVAVGASMVFEKGIVWWLPVALVVVLTLTALVLLGRFTVEVGEGWLEWHFGLLGWPRWQLPLDDIVSATPARTAWLEGWGINRTRSGMLYNAQGLQAVRLRLRDGSTLRLGSDEPERLAGFITARLTNPPPDRPVGGSRRR